MTTQILPPPTEAMFPTQPDLPPFECSDSSNIMIEIANYLKKMMHKLPFTGKASHLTFPSASRLAEALHCSEIHIYDALQLLADEYYEFEIHGLDGQIYIRDPLKRTEPCMPPWKRWFVAAQSFFQE